MISRVFLGDLCSDGLGPPVLRLEEKSWHPAASLGLLSRSAGLIWLFNTRRYTQQDPRFLKADRVHAGR